MKKGYKKSFRGGKAVDAIRAKDSEKDARGGEVVVDRGGIADELLIVEGEEILRKTMQVAREVTWKC